MRHSALGILLLYLSGDAVLGLEVALELMNAVVYLLAGFLNLGDSQLVVLFSFLVLKLKVTSFTILLKSLVLLPVLHALL